MSSGASALDGKLLVAAIYFGTAYSGYVYSFRNDYKLDPLKITTNHWTGEGSQTMSPKAPSSVLLNPDKTFNSFGYKAEEEYSSLVDNGQHNDCYFFKEIKMRLLYREKISRTATIDDESGKPMLGLIVLSMIIRYLREDLFKRLEQRGMGLRDQDVLWVLTVPAIWSDAAKQFTKEAAQEAGINPADVLLVYEPEAAALYCRFQKLQNISDAKDESNLSKKRKMMVFDMGGGTTDISVIEIKSPGKDGKEEIHIVERACGGAFGRVFVNEKFIKWLDNIFGKETMKQFESEHRSDYMSLITNFEEKKNIPQFLKSSTGKRQGCSLEEHFAKLDISGVQVKKRGKLFLPSSFLFETCFFPIAKDVFGELQQILTKHGDIDCVVAVGGLAQSPAVVSEIRKYARDIPVYVPFDSSHAVVSGAVLYGHDKNVIKARVCPYSYGIQSMRPFIEGKDDESKKVKQEGETWCKHSFRALYNAGDLVRLGEVCKYDFMESFTDENRQGKREKPILRVIFASKDRKPRYVTDPGCHEHGTLSIDPPNTGFPDHYECTVGFEFAGTEIIARLNEEERIIKTVKLDFLN